MTATCPNGHAVEPGAKFCSECGAALAETTTPVTPVDAAAGTTTEELPALGASAAPNGDDDEGPIFVMSDPIAAPPRHGRWKSFALLGAIALIGVVIAASILSGGGSNETSGPAAAAAKPTAKKHKLARPTRYSQLLPRGLTAKKAAAPACGQYETVIGRWQQTARSRIAAINGVGNDPYAAADFVGRSGNGWVRATTEPTFERAITTISRKRLIGATGTRSGLITPTMVERFKGDALFICHLGAAVRDTEAKLTDLDRNASALTGLAASKPWYPKGYSADPADDSVAWVWDNNIGKCQGNDFGYCWGMRVITRDGCPNSVYAEINILSGDTVIDYSNDTVGSLEPGEVAELSFQSFEQGYGTLTGRLKEINCY